MSSLKNRESYDVFRKEVRGFVLGECEDIAKRIDNTGKAPTVEIVARLKAMGLFGLTIPEEYGGQGLPFSDYWPILADVAMTHHSIRSLVHGPNSGIWRVLNGATEEQRREHLPPIAAGEEFPAFCLTEPDAGTGKDIKTIATRNEQGYVLNGRKHLISLFGGLANPFIVIAVTDKRAGANGISAFFVERHTRGFKVVRQPETMGRVGSLVGELIMENCVIAPSNILGSEGHGYADAMGFLEISRVAIAACCLGISQRSLDLSLSHAKRRITFGRPIADRQAIQGLLAEMEMETHALRLMVAHAAQKFDRGERVTKEASMCKLFGIETSTHVTDKAMLVFGGIGYTRAYPIERLYRDARGLWFEEGAPTVQRMTIARDLLGKPQEVG